MARKRRKRTNSEVPAKGRLRDIADRLWSLAVRADWNHQCAVCGKRGGRLDAHHLIPRQHQRTRYELRNGICLCVHHHQFDPHLSPHQNAAGWINWLKRHHEQLYGWYGNVTATGEYQWPPVEYPTINADYYCDQIWCLREYVEEWESVVGVRFAAYLDGQHA